MSHLHIPDGIINPIWLLIGFIVTGLIICLSLFMLRKRDIQKLVPRIGIISAVMLLGMSVPLPVGIGYHLNLSVLVGIILGPWAGFISAFIVNLILALMGHGGVTVIGLNSLIIGSEVIFGFLFFKVFSRFLRINISALITTFFVLALSTSFMIGIVGITQINPAKFLHHHEHNHQTQLEEHSHQVESQEELSEISLVRFAKIIIPFAFIGWVIESLVTSIIISFVGRVKPDLFYEEKR
ncbi:energy-coupling factor ABC transporter permease [Candidatus Oleimmundimicrobium sp.]|uniref:energy-coupling factor ABC transporter permease n=1 Tax=Candidatus Oleimmundimicrobium sp. TaxID=3060597 RepID=UPI00271759ED|nr:energy-coupling factor ABC transporter permease [Candidatus Oleimmundimicrobium sp.]MDO8886603.1 energy-coupling factor ABC transporter permease [Candidatus Oleimmundimicrobium sp.]